jgi:restriction endonuclease S subunit
VLELKNLATVLSGVTIKEDAAGRARFVRLSDLSDLKSGRTPILARGVVPEVARALSIDSGDLIVAARGSATDVCIADESVFGAFVTLDLYLIRPNGTKVDTQYLFAFLTLPTTQALFAAGKQGSALARLPKEELAKIKVPLPPMQTQRMIADLACSFEQEGKILRKLSDLNLILRSEVVARAINAAETTNHKRSNKKS